MCPASTVEHKWLLTVANVLLWGIPQHYISLLEDLYMNEQVYVDQWTHFMSLCLADWTNSLSWVRRSVMGPRLTFLTVEYIQSLAVFM